MIRKLLIVTMMLLAMMTSVSAFTVTNNDTDFDILGDGTISGTVTITSTETDNITVTGNSTIDLDDFSSTVTYSPTSAVLTPNSSVNMTYTLTIPEDAAGEYTGTLSFTDGTTTDTVALNIDVSQLELSDLDVKVGSERDTNIYDEEEWYKIDKEGKPGDEVTFSLELKNLFSGDDDNDIEGDIEIEVEMITLTVEDIDNGDEVEEEFDGVDIDPDEREELDIGFTIPYEATSDTYDVTLEIEAEDEEGRDMDITKTFQLEVNRDRHDIIIQNAYFTQSEVDCDRGATLKIKVMNIGEKTEDEVVVTVKNDELDISLSKDGIELDDDPDDDYEQTLTFNVAIPEDVKAGIYTFDIRAYYDDTEVIDAAQIDLTVEKCIIEEPEEEEEEEEEAVIITPTQDESPVEDEDTTVAEPVVEKNSAVQIKESFTEGPMFVVFLVALNIVVIALVIWLVARFLTR